MVRQGFYFLPPNATTGIQTHSGTEPAGPLERTLNRLSYRAAAIIRKPFFSGILSLLMGSLSQTWKPFPMVIMGSFATLSGILAYLFPETTGERLPETMDDAIRIGQFSDRNLCGCRKKPMRPKDTKDREAEPKIGVDNDRKIFES